jgi:adenosylhomocysteine nucleosidase
MSGFERVKGSTIPLHVSRFEGAEILAVITGVGIRSVESELRDLFRKTPDVCITSGLAGGLKRPYTIGSVLVGKTIKTTGSGREIQSADYLVKAAKECGAVAVDCFFTSNKVVNSPAEKLRLSRFGDAVDMESYQVLSLAAEHGIPAVAVRAISDGAETNVPIDFNRVIDRRGQIQWAPTLREIARTPQRVPQLIRFGLDSSRAARQLAFFLDKYTRFLNGRGTAQFSAAHSETR